MEEGGEDHHFSSASAFFTQHFVTLSPFTPSRRRLSSSFSQPSQPIQSRKQLPWVSLQPRRLVRSIGFAGGEAAVSWDLFSPIHRILIVAVVAVAAANCKKNKQILRLKESVELRDEVLLGMQHKLDDLCVQVNNFKDQPPQGATDCPFCEQLKYQSNNFYEGDEVLKYETPLAKQAEPEERRMSDLSDWSDSVTSSVEIQLNNEQDIYNLRNECEEKDAVIKELSTFLQSAEAFGSKRIAELEDIIRRKNMMITKLKKDILVLDQKVINLTRLRRPSFSSTSSKVTQLPPLVDNILYDMDSTTSPSSSDSDSCPRSKIQSNRPTKQTETALRENHKLEQVQSLPLVQKPTRRYQKSRPVSPLKEKSLNQTLDSVTKVKSKQVSSVSAESKRTRSPAMSKDDVSQKRWL